MLNSTYPQNSITTLSLIKTTHFELFPHIDEITTVNNNENYNKYILFNVLVTIVCIFIFFIQSGMTITRIMFIKRNKCWKCTVILLFPFLSFVLIVNLLINIYKLSFQEFVNIQEGVLESHNYLQIIKIDFVHIVFVVLFFMQIIDFVFNVVIKNKKQLCGKCSCPNRDKQVHPISNLSTV